MARGDSRSSHLSVVLTIECFESNPSLVAQLQPHAGFCSLCLAFVPDTIGHCISFQARCLNL
jgi:hypothetical protein